MKRRGPRPSRSRVVPVTYRTASRLVRAHHDRQVPTPGHHNFSLGLVRHGQLVAVAMVGRPAAPHLDDGRTAELTHVSSDVTRSATTALLTAAWRVARSMGYQQMITHTRAHQPGVILRAAGWQVVARPTRSAPDPRGVEMDDTARATLWRTGDTTTTRRHIPRDLSATTKPSTIAADDYPHGPRS